MQKIVFNIVAIILAVCTFTACSENEDGANGGKPVVRYVRPCDASVSDSLLIGGYLGDRIAILGENLGKVNKIFFNDQKAKLNPTFVTDNAIIVDIPNGIPSIKEDMIKLYTSTDSCYYTFETKVPAPTVSSMDCEYVEDGNIATIRGMYFVNDELVPLNVSFGNLEAEIVSQDLNMVSVVVPAGAKTGPITVSSVYGSTNSSFWFRDNRNIILNFNNGNYPDYDYFFGWHGGTGVASDGGINGNYLIFGDGSLEMTDDTWNDSKFGFEVWTYLSSDPDFFDAGALDKYVLKFEIKYTNWTAAALQVIFTGATDVMLNWQNGNGLTFNSRWDGATGYLSDESYPRILFNPWKDGVGTSNGWTTATVSMADCKYNKDGGSAVAQGAGHYSGITLFINGGGVKGSPCTPVIWIDNVRIVAK